MKLDENIHLKELADKIGISNQDVNNLIISWLQDKKIIDSDDILYGSSIFENMHRDIQISEIVEFLNSIGIDSVSCKDVENLLGCEIFDDYDCPYCGGQSEIVDSESECIESDDIDIPNSSKVIWEKRICPHCLTEFEQCY